MAKKKKNTRNQPAKTKSSASAKPIIPESWNVCVKSGNLQELKTAMESESGNADGVIRRQLEQATSIDRVEVITGFVVLIAIVGFYAGSM